MSVFAVASQCQADVWECVITTEHRSAVSDFPVERLNARAPGRSDPLLLADSNVPLRSGGPLEPVAEWAATLRSTGQALAEGVQDGTLDRGLRQVLSYHVIFHWNRLGLSMRGQSILAWAARAARAAILHQTAGAVPLVRDCRLVDRLAWAPSWSTCGALGRGGGLQLSGSRESCPSADRSRR